MSGRDFRSFLASHHAEIGKDQKLINHFLIGGRPKYKQNDYDQLHAITKIKQSSGLRALQKVESLTQKKNESKDRQMLHEHKRIWEKETHKLKDAVDNIECEIASLRPETLSYEFQTTFLEELYEEIYDYEDKLNFEQKQFFKKTCVPVHELQNDINEWINENQKELSVGMHNKKNEEEVQNVITSVKQQQLFVLDQLNEEAEQLEDDLYLLCEDIGFNLHSLKLPQITVGVPDELKNLDCPDEVLLQSCFDNFNQLDERYLKYIERLEKKYEKAISRGPDGGWNDVDHSHFKHVVNQYANVSKNRRKLYIDRLKREMPHKTREQQVEHEEWWFLYKSFQSQLQSLFNAWKRDKEDLILQVTSLCSEAYEQYKKKQDTVVEHMTQKFICNYLHEKLLQHQTEKLELMKLEAEQRMYQEELEEKQRKDKESREKVKRNLDKEKVKMHRESQERIASMQREHDKKRMLELQEKIAEERAHNLQRIRFRDELHFQKVEYKKQLKQEEKIEKIKKEKRIQALRDQVTKNVEDDPQRVYEPTEAYKAHLASQEDEELEAQTPLFHTYTYSVDQVAQDKRLKIENALRRANLHMSEYGRKLISTIPPPTQPRKDTMSTAFNIERQ